MRHDYVTADWHFNHERILAFERSDCGTMYAHNKRIVDNYNAMVSDDDTVYVLGDVGFGAPQLLGDIIKQLHGHKILVFGNHDRFTATQGLEMGFEQVLTGPFYYPSKYTPGRIILSHEPAREAFENHYVINVHGHLHNAQLNLPNFFNVNVARTDYKPVPMYVFESKCKNYVMPRREQYGKEWYFNSYQWDVGKGPTTGGKF